MRRHQPIASVIAAVLAWAAPASAVPPLDADDEGVEAGRAAPSVPAPASWFPIDARNRADGPGGLVALLFGVARERGLSQPASLRVDCFDGVTTVHIDTVGLRPGSSAIAIRHSLDGGPFVQAAWQASADGSSLKLSADRAIAFLTGLYGRTELRLAVVRPLSVPFVITFAVGGAEQALSPMADRCHWSEGPAISDAGR